MPAWSANGEANGVFAQMLVKTNNKIDGVIAANDNIAGAVVAQLKAKHLKPIPLSGQDATVEGAQYIISGWQTGTVYKPVPLQATAAAAAAIALLHGKKPATTTTRNNGKKTVPTVALPDHLDHEERTSTSSTGTSSSRRATSASASSRSTASRSAHHAVTEEVEAPRPGASTCFVVGNRDREHDRDTTSPTPETSRSRSDRCRP